MKTVVGGDGHGSQEKQCIERTSDPPRRGLTPLLRSKKQKKEKERKRKKAQTKRDSQKKNWSAAMKVLSRNCCKF
jgi:hypothetical protein